MAFLNQKLVPFLLLPTESSRPICSRTLGLVLFLFLATQWVFLSRPSINLEFAFLEAARSLADLQPHDRIDYFWRFQANPLGYPFLASLLLRAFPMIDHLAVVRLLSVFGGVLLLVSVADLLRYIPSADKAAGLWSLILVATHPVIWLYTNNATADILPAGLTMAALACCCRGRTNLCWHFWGIPLFCLACVIKFHCALFGVAIFYILMTWGLYDRANYLKHMVWLFLYAAVSAASLAIYFYVIHQRYGIVVLPEQFKGTLAVDTSIAQIISKLSYYFVFLILFSGPLASLLLCCFFNDNKLKLGKKLLIFMSMLFLGLVLQKTPRAGEMDFGGLDQLLQPILLSLTLAAGFVLVFLLFYFLQKNFTSAPYRGFSAFISFTSIPYLLVCSTTRPVQRYLILVLPLVVVWFVYALWDLWPTAARKLMIASLAVFIVLTTVGAFYLDSQARAADRMGQWIAEHGLLEKTDPGILVNHIGYLFPLQAPKEPRYRLEIWPSLKNSPAQAPVHTEPVFIGPLLIKQFVVISEEDCKA